MNHIENGTLLVAIEENENNFLPGKQDIENYLKTKQFNEEWLKHGGQSTIDAYQNVSIESLNKHIDFLENLKDYHIDQENRLFVHAGFTNVKGVDFEYFKKSLTRTI